MKLKNLIKRAVISLMAIGTAFTSTSSFLPTKAATHTVTTSAGIGYTYVVTNSDGVHSVWDNNASIIYIDGEVGFCVQPGYKLNTGNTFSSSTLTMSQKDELSIIAYEGWEQSSKTNEDWLATQFYIWETLGATINSSSFLSKYNSTYKPAIKARVAKHDTKPSFHNGMYELNVGESITLTDTNGVLSDFYVYSNGGATVSKSGDKLTITATSSTSEKTTIQLLKIPQSKQGISLVYSNGSQDVAKFYLQDPIPSTITIKVNKTGSLKITKQDEDGTLVPNTSFKLSSDSNMSSPIGTYTTGSDGTVTVSDLLAGTYYVQETSVPSHLNLDSTIYKVTVTANKTATYTATNSWKKGKIQLVKTDSNTGVQVAGATYAIYDASGNEVQRLVTTASGYVESNSLRYGNYTVKEIIAPTGYVLNDQVYSVAITQNNQKVTVNGQDKPIEGYIQVTKTDADTGKTVTKANTTFSIYKSDGTFVEDITTNSKGVATSSALTYGDYYLVEKSAPNGYTVSSQKITYKIREEGKTYTAELSNTRVLGTITMTKVDSVIGNTAQGEATLEGAVYGLYAKEDIVDPADGSVIYKAGTLIKELTTDANGQASVSNLYLGKYYLKEISASNGYTLDTTEYDITLSYKDQNTSVVTQTQTVKERVISQAFQLIKISDNNSGEADILEGAEFTIKSQADIDAYGSWEAAPVAKNANGEEASVLVTDKNGYALSDELPYGTYVIRETKVPDNMYQIPDFTVTISEDSRDPQPWRIFNDEKFKAVIAIVKEDAETGETVAVEGATFKIKNLATNEYVGYWEWFPLPHYVTEWTTSELGTVMTGNALSPGEYQLEEVKAPNGYLINTEPVKFTVSMNIAYETLPDGTTPVITVKLQDTSVKGKIRLKKEGEVLQDATITEDGVDFSYELRGLPDAVYGIYAAEDIKSASQNHIVYEKDTLIQKVVTNDEGSAESMVLPLGKYYVKELVAPKGYMLSDEVQYVELVYEDQEIAYVLSEVLTFYNEREKVEVEAIKYDANEKVGVAGAEISLFANRNIYNYDGDIIVQANTLIEKVQTLESGKAIFLADLPYDVTPEYAIDLPILDESYLKNDITYVEGDENGLYYVTETKAPVGYQLKEEDKIAYCFAFANKQEKSSNRYVFSFYNEQTDTAIVKTDEEGNMLEGAELALYDENGKEIDRWVSTKEAHHIYGLHIQKEYTIKELTAPNGYVKTQDISFIVEEDGQTYVEIENKQTQVEIHKIDTYTKENLAGATLSLYDEEGTLIDTWVSTEKGKLIQALTVGEKYIVKEVEAPKGYEIGEEVLFIVEEQEGVQTICIENEKIKETVATFDTTNSRYIKGMCIISAMIIVVMVKNRKKKREYRDNYGKL